METHFYHVELVWNEGRQGTLSSEVLNHSIRVATPPEFPQGVAGVWSPEHLLVSAVSSCLMTTFLAIADNSKLNFLEFSCRAEGKLETVEGKYMISEIHLLPKVVLPKDENPEKAEKILQKAERACLISNSVKSKISMTTEILQQETLSV
ncbi:MAG: OsmC family protein [Microscillaceae bacterium]|jgi:peroxiredoxin-like protein|nr:OsmC family protein [Microscillaceae bacterium]